VNSKTFNFQLEYSYINKRLSPHLQSITTAAVVLHSSCQPADYSLNNQLFFREFFNFLWFLRLQNRKLY